MCVVSAKRKRQEEFQSRKRQSLNPAISPAPAANHTTTTTTTPASPPGAPAEQASLAAEGSDAMMMEASLTAAVPLNEQAAEKETVGGPEGPGTIVPGNGLLAASLGQTPHDPVTGTNGNAGIAPGRALPEAKRDANGGTAADMAQPVVQQGQQDGVTQAEARQGNEQKMNSYVLPSSQRYVVAKPVNGARGHTGYLTFARRSVDD